MPFFLSVSSTHSNELFAQILLRVIVKFFDVGGALFCSSMCPFGYRFITQPV
jgi:hypothetical protein